jgi:hypothetical protein
MTNNTLYDFSFDRTFYLLSWKRYHKFCACFRLGASHHLLPKFTDVFCFLNDMMRLLVPRDFLTSRSLPSPQAHFPNYLP